MKNLFDNNVVFSKQSDQTVLGKRGLFKSIFFPDRW